MKKLTMFLIGGLFLLGTVACQDTEKTSTDAPNSTQDNANAPTTSEVQDSKEDAQSEIRRDQLNSDIRANEQRNNTFNDGGADRSDDALETEVRSKLEANIPKGQLAIDAENGIVTVTGTVPNEQDIEKVDRLAPEIKGVKQVVNKVTYAPPTNKQ